MLFWWPTKPPLFFEEGGEIMYLEFCTDFVERIELYLTTRTMMTAAKTIRTRGTINPIRIHVNLEAAATARKTVIKYAKDQKQIRCQCVLENMNKQSAKVIFEIHNIIKTPLWVQDQRQQSILVHHLSSHWLLWLSWLEFQLSWMRRGCTGMGNVHKKKHLCNIFIDFQFMAEHQCQEEYLVFLTTGRTCAAGIVWRWQSTDMKVPAKTATKTKESHCLSCSETAQFDTRVSWLAWKGKSPTQSRNPIDKKQTKIQCQNEKYTNCAKAFFHLFFFILSLHLWTKSGTNLPKICNQNLSPSLLMFLVKVKWKWFSSRVTTRFRTEAPLHIPLTWLLNVMLRLFSHFAPVPLR